MPDTLFAALERAVPDLNKPLFILADGETVSYGETFALAARFADALHGLGIRPGDRVAVQVDKSWQAIALYVGTLKAGAVYLPLNTGYTESEISYFLSDAQAALFVCRPALLQSLSKVAHAAGVAAVASLGTKGEGTLMDAAEGTEGASAPVARGPDDLAAILYTSGTTGRSKGAMLSHGNLLSNASTLKDYWRFTEKDVLLHALPIFHTHGLFVATNTLMLAGGSMIFLPKFDADEVLRLLPQATSMMGVPTFYTRLLDHPGLTREAAAHVRLFTSGSAPLLAETHAEFEARTGHRILERYGMTETNMNTSNPYDGDRRPGTVGFPLPGVELRVADPDTGAALATDEIGGLEVRGPNVFLGYWQMPEKTAEEFRDDGFFITGDLGKIDVDGYVHIVGRAKDLIISGGYNVYPKEIESEIDQLDGVLESAVIGVKHRDFGEAVTAVVVARKGSQPTERDIQTSLDGRLARFKIPKRVVFVDELPRNTMGKVQKNLLREEFGDLYAG
ncbi:malonate--CoA ligase [Lutibaculum baratangense]|uniref:3-methylmercaptopropionyl-CoA ligase n=1 Tax=Lutibaculum baratangense AMV1 TaxID=631454 RepID=V4RLQ2_9HYPH|nr:malonyl-CoA synthase [Lutibaculum baratangense]ESR26249.1 Long-chain-fatty-acid--CoA ligase [Lutibaculum baratangense AMV1]